MASKLETDAVEPQSGTTLTLGAAGDTVDLSTATVTLPAVSVTAGNLASSLDLSGKTVTLPAASVTAHTDTTPLEDDIALLGFKVAANGSLSKYNLADQTIDDFQDATGIDAGGSADENFESTQKYFSGKVAGTTTFTETGTVIVPASISSVNLLVVAGGGGGGGGDRVGGGGGGGVVYVTSHSVTGGNTYTATVGNGGGVNSVGGDSTLSGTGTTTITAKGGGNGGHRSGSTFNPGGSGGSGGGGAMQAAGGSETQTGQSGVSGSSGYGNAGGAGSSGAGNPDGGGGGGGAGGAGSAGVSGSAGDGGAGYNATGISWIGTSFGASGYFSGGGGGSIWTGTGGAGINGGGTGGTSATDGTRGTANTGGGGGGDGATAAGIGGSGFIGINWSGATSDMTLISNATTAEAVPTKGDLVMTYTNGAGTATINTDIKGWVSRDNGTTYTQATLASQGTTGGHTILTAHDVDISSQPSGTSIRYKITTHNQSVSLETRIRAVSLGWS